MNNLILIRGLPGSGKSTVARMMNSAFEHFEADMWFMVGDQYVFAARRRIIHD